MEWTLGSANRRALASSRVTTSTESASDVWAWPMHETRSLDFLTASTVRILHLKHWALDSRFFDRKSAVLVRRAARGSDAELKAMESEQ